MSDGEILSPQDELVLTETNMEWGRSASLTGDWEAALSWYDRVVGLWANLLVRIQGLERPTDLHATYARLYTLMADTYRFADRGEDQRSWVQRAYDGIDDFVGLTPTNDSYALGQQDTAYTFIGDCMQARAALNEALEEDLIDIGALANTGVITLLQDRPDLAHGYWQHAVEWRIRLLGLVASSIWTSCGKSKDAIVH